MRSAIYEELPWSERAVLHARAAQLLQRGRRDPGAVATHLLLSDPAGRAATVDLLRDAAHAALARGAPETAFEFLGRAQRERPARSVPPALLLELGVAASRAGRADAAELLREAFRVAPGQPARARAGLELAFALGVSDRRSGAVIEVLELAREGLEDASLRALLDARLVMFAILVPGARARLAGSLHEARAALEHPMSDEARVLLGPLTADLLFQGAPAADVRALAERALVGGELMRARRGDGIRLRPRRARRADPRRRPSRREAAHRRRRRARPGRGFRFGLARLCAYRGLLYWRLGELATAESDAQFALSVEGAWGIPHAVATAVLAQVQIERGDAAGARRHLDSLGHDEAILEVTPNQIVRETHATLLLAEGRAREALVQLHACAHWQEQSGCSAAWAPSRGVRRLRWRTPGSARPNGHGGSPRASCGSPASSARPRSSASRCAPSGSSRAGGRPDDARGVGRGPGDLRRRARTRPRRLEHGALLRRCGQRGAATQALRAGIELADRCGARSLVQMADGELRLCGARPKRIATHGRDSLTPGEHRVSDLAAQGMSNKQIAQALFVTLRTVEMHLSNAYRKLEISSREQLPVALG